MLAFFTVTNVATIKKFVHHKTKFCSFSGFRWTKFLKNLEKENVFVLGLKYNFIEKNDITM